MSIQRVVFVGSKALGVNVLKTLYNISPNTLAGVITIDDTNDVRCALSQFYQFKEETNIPLFVLNKPSELKTTINELKPDLCIVVGWYWLLKVDLLKMVPYGWLGIHGSLLPKYRGSAPLVWAIINGEASTGLSLFYFDEGMDTGDIVAQKRIIIKDEDTINDLLSNVERESISIVKENYPLLLRDNAPRTKQRNEEVSYVAPRVPTDGRINWNKSSLIIYNFIRAQTHPYPGAFFYLDDSLVRVWSAKPFEHNYFGSEGQVVLVAEDYAVVTCGNGTAIYLYRIQIDGLEEQNASEVLKFGRRLG